jgi:acyl transferase domain-containing protein
MSIGGGINTILTPYGHILLNKSHALSPEGRCKTFDASADGYVRSEGCGIVILKRLDDAKREGNTIRAVICGSSVSQDGASSGLTVPNGVAQESLIQKALKSAGIEPNQVDFIETHGTGTPLGDPIETMAITRVYGANRSLEHPLIIGAVKSNIGHAEAAAGVAGLIKVVLAMENNCIPANLHFNTLNPRIDFGSTPVQIPTKNMDWSPNNRTRYAGVSSFGFSGTISHLIMKESPVEENVDCDTTIMELEEWQTKPSMLTISAKSEGALKDLVARYHEHATKFPEQNIADLAYTTTMGRSHFKNHRIAVIAKDIKQLLENLSDLQRCITKGDSLNKERNKKIAFLFTGQGSQYLDMGKTLYKTHPVFKGIIDQCAEILSRYIEIPLLDLIFSKEEDSEDAKMAKSEILNQTVNAQPALFAIGYALAKLWEDWGVIPDYVMGHSVGEYIAATISGVMSLEDGLKLISSRARLMQNLAKDLGGMLAVKNMDTMDVQNIVKYYLNENPQSIVDIAALNGPSQVVLSGKLEDLSALSEIFKSKGIKTQLLQVSHAFHSGLMEPMLDEFEKIASTITYNEPHHSIVSNLTGKVLYKDNSTFADEINAQYWRHHVREPVNFVAGMKTLDDSGCTTYIEIGPQSVLLTLGMQSLANREVDWIASLHKQKSNWQSLLESLGKLYVNGFDIDWKRFNDPYSSFLKKITLPTYPFQREKHWPSDINNYKADHDKWLYQIDWIEQPLVEPSKPTQVGKKGCWLLFVPTEAVCEKIINYFVSDGYQTCFVTPGDMFKKSSDHSYQINPQEKSDYIMLMKALLETKNLSIEGVIHLWSLDGMPHDDNIQNQQIQDAHILGVRSILYLSQSIIEMKFDSIQLCIVTLLTHAIMNNQHINISQTPINGFLKSMRLEYPNFLIKHVDADQQDDLSIVYDEIHSVDKEVEIGYRQGVRYVSRLVQHDKKDVIVDDLTFKDDASYLITGGMGGLGLKVCHWLIGKGAKNLILVGRSKPQNIDTIVSELSGPTSAIIKIAQADVSNESELRKLLQDISHTMSPLRGIFHCAGLLNDASLQNQTWNHFEKVIYLVLSL